MSTPLDRVNAFLDEVRSVESQWLSQMINARQGIVVGESPWRGRLELLREIQARHGFTPGHVLVQSITAYLRDREQVEGERIATMRQRGWPPKDHTLHEYTQFLFCFEIRCSNCLARNIPGQPLQWKEIRTPAELWAYITRCLLPVRSMLDHRERERPSLCPKDVEGVYGAMHSLGLDAPAPPFPQFTEQEAEIELMRIANGLERADREQYAAAIAEKGGLAADNMDDDLPWPEYMTANDLADRLGLPPDATRKKLERLAERIDCRRQVESPRKGEAKWTYRTESVLSELRGG